LRAVLLVPFLCLAACSQPTTTGNSEVDINDAAERARGDINTYNATDTMSEVATNGATALAIAGEQPLAPAEPGQPGGLPDDRTPVSEG